MRSSLATVSRLLIGLALVAAAPMVMHAQAQPQPYKPKTGILNWKTFIFGGGFRVTTVLPLHGDFSKYDRLEIVRPESLIGPNVPAEVISGIVKGLVTEFSKGGRFADVQVVDSFTPPLPGATPVRSATSFRDADPINAPMRSWQDLLAFDRQRDTELREAATLVVRSEILDYAKGNKYLQLLLVDLGASVLTLRVSYLDKVTGQELGRSVISSDNASRIVPSLFSTRSPLSGIAEGLVDQITRRKAAGER